MTITSPVTHDVSGDVVQQSREVLDDGSESAYVETGYIQEELSVPWEFGFGMALSVPTFLVAADLRYVDWSQLKVDNATLESYRETFALHIGGEYVLPAMGTKIRAGFTSEPLAYTAASIVEDRRYYTLGAGFLVGQVMTLDLAWVWGSWKTSRPSITEKYQVGRMFLTMAYRF